MSEKLPKKEIIIDAEYEEPKILLEYHPEKDSREEAKNNSAALEAETGYDRFPDEESQPAETIKGAQNFDELYKVLEETGGLKGSRKDYTADELKSLVDEVREGKKGLSFITRTGGLRDQVKNIMEREKSESKAESLKMDREENNGTPKENPEKSKKITEHLLKLKGLEGESYDKAHKEIIEWLSKLEGKDYDEALEKYNKHFDERSEKKDVKEPEEEQEVPINNDEEVTRKEGYDRLRDVVGKLVEKTKEKFGMSERGKQMELNLESRSKELDAKAVELGMTEKSFRWLGEQYNKRSIKEKILIGVALGLGTGFAATSLSLVGAIGLTAGVIGLAAQRTAGLASMFLKYEKNGLSKGKALGKAVAYQAAMTGGMMLLVEGVKEGIDEKGPILDWLKHHWPFSANTATPSKSVIYPNSAPVTAESFKDVLPQEAVPHSNIPIPMTEVPSVHPPEVPEISADAHAGRGYEYMVKKLWEQLQDKHLDPSKYSENSDIHKLLTADAKSIDGVVHRIAANPEHGFFHNGESVRIDMGSHMTVDAHGNIQLNGDIHAPADAQVTPAYHPEAPHAPTPEAQVADDNVAEVSSTTKKEDPVTREWLDKNYPLKHTPDASPSLATDYPATSVETQTPEAPAIDQSVTNSFGLKILPGESHIYADPDAKHLLVYGGSPTERADTILAYLTDHPDKVVYGADANGENRIPWHLVDRKLTPGAPVQTSGFLGFFKSFMEAPKPEEFQKLIK